MVLGQRIYYLSSEKARAKFLGDPSVYVTQPAPLPHYPPKLAVQGLPKSGKTSGAYITCLHCISSSMIVYICTYGIL